MGPMNLNLSEEYVEECQRAWSLHKSTPWRMGDLVVEGIAEYAPAKQERALFLEQLAAQLECSPKTLANYARVSEEFLPDTRFEALELGHHEAVLKLEPDQRIEMLTRAAEEMWTVARLRREIADAKPPEPDEMPSDEVLVLIPSIAEIGRRRVVFRVEDENMSDMGVHIVLTSNSPLRWRKGRQD